MNKEAYEAGIKLAFAKYGLSWQGVTEGLAKFYAEHPYLSSALTSGGLNAGIGALIDGPKGAAIFGLAGIGGGLTGAHAAKLYDEHLAKRILAGDMKLIEQSVKNPNYLTNATRLVQMGSDEAASLALTGLGYTVLPNKPEFHTES